MHRNAELRRFLAKTCDLKAMADCGAEPDSAVPREQVEEAIATAARFIDAVTALLA